MPNFWGIVMAKYSTEAKRKVVYEYLAGHGSYETLSKLYHVLCASFFGGVIKRSLSMGSDVPVHSKSTLFNLSVLRYNLNQIIRMILWAV